MFFLLHYLGSYSAFILFHLFLLQKNLHSAHGLELVPPPCAQEGVYVWSSPVAGLFITMEKAIWAVARQSASGPFGLGCSSADGTAGAALRRVEGVYLTLDQFKHDR